jgi:hypothetical protein
MIFTQSQLSDGPSLVQHLHDVSYNLIAVMPEMRASSNSQEHFSHQCGDDPLFYANSKRLTMK